MSDLIDREALLRQIDIDSEGEPGYYGDTWKFIDTIKNMPNVHDLPKDTDTISRQAAIKILHEALDAADQIADVPFGVYQNYRDKMNELPPAQPEHIRGHWIRDRSWSEGVGMGESYGHYWKCDKCGHLEKSNGGVCGCNFCSNCGSDNRKEKEK